MRKENLIIDKGVIVVPEKVQVELRPFKSVTPTLMILSKFSPETKQFLENFALVSGIPLLYKDGIPRISLIQFLSQFGLMQDVWEAITQKALIN